MKQTTQTTTAALPAPWRTVHSFRLYQIIESPNRLIKFAKCHDCIFCVFPSVHFTCYHKHMREVVNALNAKYFWYLSLESESEWLLDQMSFSF